MTTTQPCDSELQEVSEHLEAEKEWEHENLECIKTQDEMRNRSSTEDSKFTPIFRINQEESFARNRKFLKDLELEKARLRTYAAYTPTDRELQQIAAEYRKHLQKYLRKSRS